MGGTLVVVGMIGVDGNVMLGFEGLRLAGVLVLGVLNEHSKVLSELFEFLKMLPCSSASRLIAVNEKLAGVALNVLDASGQLAVLFHSEGVRTGGEGKRGKGGGG